MSKGRLSWRTTPTAADLNAALAYLSLIYPSADPRSLVAGLRGARTVQHAAKDLLRASGLPLLPPEEKRVGQDLKKIRKHKPLSPVLLIQGDLSQDVPLVIADGYHRICAVCHFDEDAPVSCRMVSTRGLARASVSP
jgi:hypothetical protein